LYEKEGGEKVVNIEYEMGPKGASGAVTDLAARMMIRPGG
jgi:hypothetical protein